MKTGYLPRHTIPRYTRLLDTVRTFHRRRNPVLARKELDMLSQRVRSGPRRPRYVPGERPIPVDTHAPHTCPG
jgi:hypothetical protein